MTLLTSEIVDGFVEQWQLQTSMGGDSIGDYQKVSHFDEKFT